MSDTDPCIGGIISPQSYNGDIKVGITFICFINTVQNIIENTITCSINVHGQITKHNLQKRMSDSYTYIRNKNQNVLLLL
jgi:hypothetical protein